MKLTTIKKFVFLFSAAICVVFVFSLIRIDNSRNEIDFLNDSLAEVKAEINDSAKIYLVSNYQIPLSKTKIYFHTQLALVPKLVVKEEFESEESKFNEIPGNCYLLIINDLTCPFNVPVNKSILDNFELLSQVDNTMFTIILLIKKPL